MKRVKLLTILLFGLATIQSTLLLASGTQGNRQTRQVSGFHGVSVSSGIDLYLTQKNTEEVVVEAESDDLDKIIDLANLLVQGTTTKTEIAEYFDFDERQADYYANAAAYLGWVARQAGGFHLTEAGEHFARQRCQRLKNW